MTFQNVTSAQLQAAKEHLSANGATVSPAADGNSGNISGHGISADFSFDPGAGVLTVDVVHKPFFVPLSGIQSQIADGLAKA